jgi:hypothetical protein
VRGIFLGWNAVGNPLEEFSGHEVGAELVVIEAKFDGIEAELHGIKVELHGIERDLHGIKVELLPSNLPTTLPEQKSSTNPTNQIIAPIAPLQLYSLTQPPKIAFSCSYSNILSFIKLNIPAQLLNFSWVIFFLTPTMKFFLSLDTFWVT